MKKLLFGITLFCMIACVSCSRNDNNSPVDNEPLDTVGSVTANFESGSIGEVERPSNLEWELSLADDNGDATLPDTWRSWWYVQFTDIVTDAEQTITITNRGWPYYYVPVYSYDQVTWSHFEEDEIVQGRANEIVITKQFEHDTVWMARYFPYTFSNLEAYIAEVDNSTSLEVQTPGMTQNGKPLYLFKLTDPSVADSAKKRIFMHGRTHPAEVPSSFLVEGIVDFLLSETVEAADILAQYEFYIFPMQNVDGVVAGNYRTTPQSENLEIMWYSDSLSPLALSSSAPVEVAIVQEYARSLMEDGGPRITMALNLHSSNSEPDTRPFFFPHFGTEAQGYLPEEASLWKQQLALISALGSQYGSDMLEPVVIEGGGSFAVKNYPESWWWRNYKDSVMAITLETTYGRAGYASRWSEPNDIRNLGEALVLAIRDAYDTTLARSITPTISTMQPTLRYPELYPAIAIDEMKE